MHTTVGGGTLQDNTLGEDQIGGLLVGGAAVKGFREWELGMQGPEPSPAQCESPPSLSQVCFWFPTKCNSYSLEFCCGTVSSTMP